jgi:hypothetical protein
VVLVVLAVEVVVLAQVLVVAQALARQVVLVVTQVVLEVTERVPPVAQPAPPVAMALMALTPQPERAAEVAVEPIIILDPAHYLGAMEVEQEDREGVRLETPEALETPEEHPLLPHMLVRLYLPALHIQW